jgi:REP element-mobilizing transposase RayT
MPAKNTLRNFQSNNYYHIYHRGNNQQAIFKDLQDYHVFTDYLNKYLSPKNSKEPLLINNFHQDISLHAYCLLSNHYHLLLYQQTKNAISSFMQSLNTKYALYFKAKYKYQGTPFQGRYRAVHIESNDQLLYVTKYIHRNPLPKQPSRSDLENLPKYPHSSFPSYLSNKNKSWLTTSIILSYFSKNNPHLDYQSFVLEKETNLDYKV